MMPVVSSTNTASFPPSSSHYTSVLQPPQSPHDPIGNGTYYGSKPGQLRMTGLIDDISSSQNVDSGLKTVNPYIRYAPQRQPPEHTYPLQSQTIPVRRRPSHPQHRISTVQSRPASSGMLVSPGRGGQSADRLQDYPENFVKMETNGDRRVMDLTPSQRDVLPGNNGQLLQQTNDQVRMNTPSGASCCSSKSVSSPPSGAYFPTSEPLTSNVSSFEDVSMPAWSSYGEQGLGNGYVSAHNIQGQDLQSQLRRENYFSHLYPPNNDVVHGTTSPELVAFSQNMNKNGPLMDLNGQCGCGLGCECLGCPEHPNNSATTSRVQELSTIIYRDEFQAQQGPGFEASLSPIDPNGFDHQVRSYGPAAGMLKPPLSLDYDSPPSQLPFTRDFDLNSPSSITHPLQIFNDPSQYITAQFDLSEASACSDPNASCSCGGDCECPNCLTHAGRTGNDIAMPLDQRFVHNFSGIDMSLRNGPTSPIRQEGRI